MDGWMVLHLRHTYTFLKIVLNTLYKASTVVQILRFLFRFLISKLILHINKGVVPVVTQ